MKKFVAIIFICLVVISCNFTKKKKPTYKIIPEKELVKLLVDYHLAEAMSNSSSFREKFRKVKVISLTDSVIIQHGYTHVDLDSTISYYSGNPTEFSIIYEKVITELSRMEAKVEKKTRDQTKKRK
jgi:hypothetical protein